MNRIGTISFSKQERFMRCCIVFVTDQSISSFMKSSNFTIEHSAMAHLKQMAVDKL